MRATGKTITVEFDVACQQAAADLVKIERLVQDICGGEGVKKAAVSVRIVDDKEMSQVHRSYLGKNSTTDVISFDLSDEFEPHRSFALVVNAEMAARQAAKRGHSAEAELALYVTHGLLHDIGYDDSDDLQARRMHKTEEHYLDRNKFGRIYYGN